MHVRFFTRVKAASLTAIGLVAQTGLPVNMPKECEEIYTVLSSLAFAHSVLLEDDTEYSDHWIGGLTGIIGTFAVQGILQSTLSLNPTAALVYSGLLIGGSLSILSVLPSIIENYIDQQENAEEVARTVLLT